MQNKDDAVQIGCCLEIWGCPLMKQNFSCTAVLSGDHASYSYGCCSC